MPKSEIIFDSSTGRMSTKCVGYLNEITDATGAKIVVTSTWRKDIRKGTVPERMAWFGITGEILGITPTMNDLGVYRGNEIIRWVQDNEDYIGLGYHDFKRYVILDDDSDMLLWQKDNYINIDPWSGITPSIVWRSRKILGDIDD